MVIKLKLTEWTISDKYCRKSSWLSSLSCLTISLNIPFLTAYINWADLKSVYTFRMSSISSSPSRGNENILFTSGGPSGIPAAALSALSFLLKSACTVFPPICHLPLLLAFAKDEVDSLSLRSNLTVSFELSLELICSSSFSLSCLFFKIFWRFLKSDL